MTAKILQNFRIKIFIIIKIIIGLELQNCS